MRAVIFVISFLSVSAFAGRPAYGNTPIFGYVNPAFPDEPAAPPACAPLEPRPRCDYETQCPGEPVRAAVPAPPARPRDHSGPDPVIFHWVDENGVDVYSDSAPQGPAANKATRVPPSTFWFDVDVTFDEPDPGKTTG